MSFLKLTNLSFSYQSSITPLFNNLNFTFSKGWTALVGPNGSGKTTLLNILSKNFENLDNQISPNLSTYLCPQDTPDEIPEFFYDPDLINSPQTIKLLGKLEIKDDWVFNWDNLSGGEKKRCMIADALVRNPQVLLIDEPANHLDLYSLNLLSRELKLYDGIGIIISHDLEFLDSLCDMSVIMEATSNGTQLFNFACPPKVALKERNNNINYLRDEKSKQINKLNKLEKQKQHEVNIAQTSKKRLSKKDLNPKDHSAKSKIDGARLTGKDKKVTSKITIINNNIEKNNTLLNNINVPQQRKTGINLKGVQSISNNVLTLNKNKKTLINGVLNISYPEITIKNDDRIVICGDNGSGKTTFIKYLNKIIEEKKCPFWYLKQEYSKEERLEIKEKILSLDKNTQGDIFSVVYRLGSNPTSLIQSKLISPGETHKLLYGYAMSLNVSLLVLDEPTNYLDILSVQSLIEAINEFSGAVIAISHDREFINAIAKKVWTLTKEGKETTLIESENIDYNLIDS